MSAIKEVDVIVSDAFAPALDDWYNEKQLYVGSYGSGKSYFVGQKLCMKLLEEKRKLLVVRETYESIKESCFEVIKDVLDSMGILEKDTTKRKSLKKVLYRESPMKFMFPNGSVIIFKGLDKVGRIKSIHDVSLVWVEECSEISYKAWQELLGRVRHPYLSMHYILSCNPVSTTNWVYKEFFVRKTKDGGKIVLLNDHELYKKKRMVSNGVYYHHSTCDDNPFLQQEYIDRLDAIAETDEDFYRVARLGQFGANGRVVLPRFEVARDVTEFMTALKNIPTRYHFYGQDFGFAKSYNALVSMAVDIENQWLYIYDCIYVNEITDDEYIMLPKMQRLKEKMQRQIDDGLYVNPISSDDSDPKTITYQNNNGFRARATTAKYQGSRLANTRKVRRFKKIICSPACQPVIDELQELVFKEDKSGEIIPDEFSIDPHTLSAIWYGLDTYNMEDLKNYGKRNGYSGNPKRNRVSQM